MLDEPRYEEGRTRRVVGSNGNVVEVADVPEVADIGVSRAQAAPGAPQDTRMTYGVVPGSPAPQQGPVYPQAVIASRTIQGGPSVFVPSTRETVTQGGGQELQDMAIGLMPGAQESRAAAIREGELQSQEARAMQPILERGMAREAQIAEQGARTSAERMAENQAAYQRFVSTARDAGNMFVDPDRRAPAERAVAAIASFLGGLGRGPNRVQEDIDAAIERDVRAQMANQENLQAFARNMSDAFGLSRQAGMDERTLEQLAVARSERDIANEARRLANMTDIESVKNRALMLASDRDIRATQIIASIFGEGAGRTTTRETQRYRQGGPRQEWGVASVDPRTGQPVEGTFVPDEVLQRLRLTGENLGQYGGRSLVPVQAPGQAPLTRRDEIDMAPIGRVVTPIQASIGTMDSLVDMMEKIEARDEDISGQGPVGGMLPAMTQEATHFRQLLEQGIANARRGLFAGNVTPQEMQRFDDLAGRVKTATTQRGAIAAASEFRNWLAGQRDAFMRPLSDAAHAELTRRIMSRQQAGQGQQRATSFERAQ